MGKSKEEKQKNILNNIKFNYKKLEQSIVNQLYFKVDNHPLTTGHNREKIWMKLFKQIIPKKFAIRQGVFLIDSNCKVSKEVDIAIFDEQFTPYVFNYEDICFIPIEAVAVVIQCKSKSVNIDDINEWLSDINVLKGELGGVARMAGFIASSSTPTSTQKITRPLSILCHLKGENLSESEDYDLDIAASETKLSIKWNDSLKNLSDIFKKLNGLNDEEFDKIFEKKVKYCEKCNDEVKHSTESKSPNVSEKPEELRKLDWDISLKELEVKDNPILSLIFQLNQVLMLINNPMLFPHKAYVEMFDKKIS